jgi:hypothetical protein
VALGAETLRVPVFPAALRELVFLGAALREPVLRALVLRVLAVRAVFRPVPLREAAFLAAPFRPAAEVFFRLPAVRRAEVERERVLPARLREAEGDLRAAGFLAICVCPSTSLLPRLTVRP